MSDQLWVIRGFKYEVKNASSSSTIAPDHIVGEFAEDTTHCNIFGNTWNDGTPHQGFSYLHVSLQPAEEYQALSLVDKGMGAVVGGFIYKTNKTSSDPYVKEQEWGDVDESQSIYVGQFYGSGKNHMYYVRACFGTTQHVTAVSSFWSNGAARFGPDVINDRYDWGRDIKSHPDNADFAISLVPVIETTVLNIDFPTLDDSMKSVSDKPVQNDTYYNNSPTSILTQTFSITETVSDTATVSFTAGMGVAWTVGWSFSVPYINTSVGGTHEQNASFEVGSSSATSRTVTISRTSTVEVPPMSSVHVVGLYSQGVLKAEVILTVQDTYKNGIVKTYKVPATYEGVSAFKGRIVVDEAIPLP